MQKLSYYEELLADTNDKKLKRKLLEASRVYRELQNKYLSKKFDFFNNKLDEAIAKTETNLSSIVFNVISIFLGISVTSAMISGIEYVHGKLIIFYFFSCAWIALTILCLSSILLKKIDK